MHVVVWEYTVRPGAEAEFLAHYAADGTWTRLFRRAPGFLETELLRDRRDPSRFATIDRWESESAYRAFRERFAGEYETLDARCAGLTEEERCLGDFET